MTKHPEFTHPLEWLDLFVSYSRFNKSLWNIEANWLLKTKCVKDRIPKDKLDVYLQKAKEDIDGYISDHFTNCGNLLFPKNVSSFLNSQRIPHILEYWTRVFKYDVLIFPCPVVWRDEQIIMEIKSGKQKYQKTHSDKVFKCLYIENLSEGILIYEQIFETKMIENNNKKVHVIGGIDNLYKWIKKQNNFSKEKGITEIYEEAFNNACERTKEKITTSF